MCGHCTEDCPACEEKFCYAHTMKFEMVTIKDASGGYKLCDDCRRVGNELQDVALEAIRKARASPSVSPSVSPVPQERQASSEKEASPSPPPSRQSSRLLVRQASSEQEA